MTDHELLQEVSQRLRRMETKFTKYIVRQGMDELLTTPMITVEGNALTIPALDTPLSVIRSAARDDGRHGQYVIRFDGAIVGAVTV